MQGALALIVLYPAFSSFDQDLALAYTLREFCDSMSHAKKRGHAPNQCSFLKERTRCSVRGQEFGSEGFASSLIDAFGSHVRR